MSATKSFSALRAAVAPLGVAIAAVFAPGLAQADAVAQSFLNLSNFGFQVGGAVTVLNANDSGDVSASINGGAPATASANPAAFTGFNLVQSVGPNAGSYAPGSAIVGAPTMNYVGSQSFLNNGDPFVGNVVANVDNTVSLTPGGVGTAQSNAGLAAAFTLNVGAGGGTLGVAFDAVGFLRAMLNPFGVPGNASASYGWSIVLTNGAGATVFSWEPDGIVNNANNGQSGNSIFGGTETSDAFDMTRNIGTVLGGFDIIRDNTTGVNHFEAQTNTLAAGLYQLDIRHVSASDAQIVVIPEPSALSLAGLALLGMGFAARRRAAK